RALRVHAGHLRAAGPDPARQGRRDPADRRGAHAGAAGRQGGRHAAGPRRAPLRHRQLRELLPRLRRVRPVRPALRGRPARVRALPDGSAARGALMLILRRQAFARAGLVGNPSDGYHGKTISISIRNFAAEVVLYEWEDLELVWTEQDETRFRSIHDLVRDVRLHGYYGGMRLVKATIKKFAEY